MVQTGTAFLFVINVMFLLSG